MFNFKNPFTKKLREANESLNAKITEKDREIIRLRSKVQRIQDEYDWFRNHQPKLKIDEVIGHYKVTSFKLERNSDYDKFIATQVCLNMILPLFRIPLSLSLKNKIPKVKPELSTKPFPPKFIWVYEIRPLADVENENYKVFITEENLLVTQSLKED